MSGKSTITENNLSIINELLSGKYMQPSFSAKGIAALEAKTGLSNTAVYKTLEKLEQMGIIVGYIPIISEDGKHILDTFKQLYGAGKEDSLIEMVKE